METAVSETRELNHQRKINTILENLMPFFPDLRTIKGKVRICDYSEDADLTGIFSRGNLPNFAFYNSNPSKIYVPSRKDKSIFTRLFSIKEEYNLGTLLVLVESSGYNEGIKHNLYLPSDRQEVIEVYKTLTGIKFDQTLITPPFSFHPDLV